VTPTVHWWFAYLVSKLEHGPYDWTTLMFDECADLAPQSAANGQNQTYTKVEALRRVMAHSRKHYLSIFFFGHHERNVHDKIRRTIQWRIAMPDGTANPNQGDNHNSPVGFNQIPMYADMLSMQDPGRALCWTETNFTRFEWKDVPKFGADKDRWLKISFSEPPKGQSPGSNPGVKAP
jgi:hypothetical protein